MFDYSMGMDEDVLYVTARPKNLKAHDLLKRAIESESEPEDFSKEIPYVSFEINNAYTSKEFASIWIYFGLNKACLYCPYKKEFRGLIKTIIKDTKNRGDVISAFIKRVTTSQYLPRKKKENFIQSFIQSLFK